MGLPPPFLSCGAVYKKDRARRGLSDGKPHHAHTRHARTVADFMAPKNDQIRRRLACRLHHLHGRIRLSAVETPMGRVSKHPFGVPLETSVHLTGQRHIDFITGFGGASTHRPRHGRCPSTRRGYRRIPPPVSNRLPRFGKPEGGEDPVHHRRMLALEGEHLKLRIAHHFHKDGSRGNDRPFDEIVRGDKPPVCAGLAHMDRGFTGDERV